MPNIHPPFLEPTPETTLLTRLEAAKFLGIGEGTLTMWACAKRYDLPYIRSGRLTKYRLSDLLAFLERRTVYPVTESQEITPDVS